MVLFVYELFIIKSKSQVYGILHDVFFFFKRGITGHSYGIVSHVTVVPYLLLALHIISSYLQYCYIVDIVS